MDLRNSQSQARGMSFAERIKRYVQRGREDNKSERLENNEVLFCKNNVCVHPPATLRQFDDVIHNAGYLTVSTKIFIDQYNGCERSTLFLTWIPNSDLSKGVHELKRQSSLESVQSSDSNNSNDREPAVKVQKPASMDLRSTNPFLNYGEDLKCPVSSGSSSEDGDRSCLTVNVNISTPEIEIVQTPDSLVNDRFEELSRSASITSVDRTSPFYIVTPEYLMQKHNLAFPDSGSATSSPELAVKCPLKSRCRRFSVDLSQMRSLRLFFSDEKCTSGQLVVASRESQYKILHFHHGGLDRLAHVLHQWHSLLHNIQNAIGGDENLPFRHFMVCRPEVSQLEMHPEEGNVPKLTEFNFRNLFNERGQIEDDLLLRKMVFFSGMDRDIRKEVWPFLLHVYSYQSTADERVRIAQIRRQEYEEITRRRTNLSKSEMRHFKRKIQSVVEKDVIRTDRANPFYTGDNNPNLRIMENILMNYSIYNPAIGYTQGMSDLLAPVLCELKDEVAAFWCFVGLMQRALFVATPTDKDMDRCLRYLRELTKLMMPKFYKHLESHKDAMELLFCHRWILLCFKREFAEAVALRMWEACWANYQTDFYHLFLCLAIIFVYADDVLAQDLKADEMLLYFSSLAMYMDGHLIAQKARGLLHQFRQIRVIPCSLNGLCTKCGPGQWDSTHSPRIQCDCPGPCKNTEFC